MLNLISKKIISEITNNFELFEKYLYTPTSIKDFKKFLINYRGMKVPGTPQSYNRDELSKQTAENIVNFFINIFAKEGLADHSEEEILIILNEVEMGVNLSLYYWFGLNDRNYQFRTLIHFFELDGVGSVFLTKNKHDFAVSLSEDGMRFGLASSEHEPKYMPVSKVCELNLFTEMASERVLFARIRTVQREICLLIDDWEHLNAILAVEYGRTFQDFQNLRTKKAEEDHLMVVSKMNARRDTLAQWCLESFCDFQEWIEKLFEFRKFSDDIYSELQAASVVLLSGLQKIFLPASVSRHRYCENVPKLLERYALSRVRMNKDDVSSRLLLQACQSALGKVFDATLFDFVDKKPFEWVFSFDPSAAIKSFSWSYSKELHLVLSAIYGVCCFKKSLPNPIDINFLSDIATTIQMPETFPADSNLNRKIYENEVNILDEKIQNTFKLLLNFIDKNVKDSKNTKELCQFIIKNLQPTQEALNGSIS
ncbi:hypothetical protein [Fluviispira multicolorata]|uniref:Uncharacterized protein n=1 Tax=Fluviispira multicolorata TaxID=2654512 RepID=A0A833N5Z0_9BACT|nr:hypothetical protein [Fluviispira multicolorata]KAB8031884.1 hypothetical protein GCL57_04365 [Fluviispira multicolorata]